MHGFWGELIAHATKLLGTVCHFVVMSQMLPVCINIASSLAVVAGCAALFQNDPESGMDPIWFADAVVYGITVIFMGYITFFGNKSFYWEGPHVWNEVHGCWKSNLVPTERVALKSIGSSRI